jgi:hypothetical protein
MFAAMNLARAAYEAGRAGPVEWGRLDSRTRAHWDRVARAVVEALLLERERQRKALEAGW